MNMKVAETVNVNNEEMNVDETNKNQDPKEEELSDSTKKNENLKRSDRCKKIRRMVKARAKKEKTPLPC